MKCTVNNKTYEVYQIYNTFKRTASGNKKYNLVFHVANVKTNVAWECKISFTQKILKKLGVTKEELNLKNLNYWLQLGCFTEILRDFVDREFATE